jgi:hypothetical protein
MINEEFYKFRRRTKKLFGERDRLDVEYFRRISQFIDTYCKKTAKNKL